MFNSFDDSIVDEIQQPLTRILRFLKNKKSTSISLDFWEVQDGKKGRKNKFILLTGKEALKYFNEVVTKKVK